MLEAWLDNQMLGVRPQSLEVSRFAPTARRMLNLASCFQPSHILPDLQADTKAGVVEELANLASRLNLVRDKTWFVGTLIERENIMPSATGNGLAFLHTLNRHPDHVVKPFMVLGRSLMVSILTLSTVRLLTCFSSWPQISRTAPSLAGKAPADVCSTRNAANVNGGC